MMMSSLRLWMTATICLLFSLHVVVVATTDSTTLDLDNGNAFDDYAKTFGKIYRSPQEREDRREIFNANLQMILEHNIDQQQQHQQKEQATVAGGYQLGINEWTDRKIPEELPLGLKKKAATAATAAGLLTQNKVSSSSSSAEVEEIYQEWLETSVVPVSELPKEKDWRTHHPKITTDVKQQGMCGSCWAVAATAVLESHIALRTNGTLLTLSPQELVSCVQNPEHCGGAGGCDGATYELAFDYVVQHGMVPETEFPYKSGKGATVACSLNSTSLQEEKDGLGLLLRGGSNSNTASSVGVNEYDFIDGAVASIQGYINFPTNNYTVLMNAVATLGPIGVTVAANSWALYSRGVFSVKNHNSSGATDVNHAVVLEGYGIDQESQEPYWLVRNSWGSMWGEGGYIRLKRVDPSTLSNFDQDDCGIDITPSDGAGCTKDKDGNDIVPQPMKVCGTSAILYDTFIPIGGKLLPGRRSRERTPVLEEM